MARGKAAAPAATVVRKVRRKKHAAHHGGAWKIAYADFVTAMMAFFMLMWLIANPDKAKLKGLAEYFSPAAARAASATSPAAEAGGHGRRAQGPSAEALGAPTAEAGVRGPARGGTADVPEAALRVLADEMLIALEPPSEALDAPRNVRAEPARDGVRVHLVDTAGRPMFRGPTAELNDYSRELLARLARKLVKSSAQIAIEGHTDATGGHSEANWRLSGERALAARSAMVAAGLTPDRFSEVVAKAGTDPIYPERPDRPENRRITIIILSEPSALPRDASFKF